MSKRFTGLDILRGEEAVNEAVVRKKSALLMEIFGPKWNDFSSHSRWILKDAALVQYRYFQSEPALYIFPRINMYDSPAPDQTTSTINRYPILVWYGIFDLKLLNVAPYRSEHSLRSCSSQDGSIVCIMASIFEPATPI